MCGIIGYIGKKHALPILLEGLKVMEYRGYDSAGVALVRADGSFFEKKAQGKLVNLEEKLKNHSNLDASIGIGHTRWATHGEPSEVNAHPHADCTGRFRIAHNGIIENYLDLKERMILEGHVFTSETDTEVIAHLIEKYARNGQFEQAVHHTLHDLIGTYGLVVIDREHPAMLIAARHFSPLNVGILEDQYFVASDTLAFLTHTRRQVELEDGEIAVLTPYGYRILDINGNTCHRKPQDVELSVEQVKKGGYPHFMLKEIFEQPKSLQDVFRGRLLAEEGTMQFGGLRDVMHELVEARRIIIVACGTSKYAGDLGKYVLEELAGIPTTVELASEFHCRAPVFSDGDVVIAISQSGETADTIAAIKTAKREGVLCLGIVNVVGSTVARSTDAGVYLHIGPEIGVASTKAFTAQYAVLTGMALALGRLRGHISLEDGREIVSELKGIPALMQTVLAQKDRIGELAESYQWFEHFFFLGRKYGLPVAFEGALKLKEISYLHAEGNGAGEMKHGFIALVDPRLASIVVAVQGSVYAKMMSNIQEIKARQGPILAIATDGDEKIGRMARDVIYVPCAREFLQPFVTTLPLQLLAYEIAVRRGCDVDHPRNLAKSVTVE